MKYVAITGPENAGKSDLAQALAEHYHTSYAREYAREFLNGTGGKYEFTDLDTICRGQILEEEKALSAAKGICFFDTEMLVLKIWSEYRFGKVSDFINENLENRIYHHYLLCAPDLPWTPDPFRESPSLEEREHLFARYKRELERMKASFSIIEGTGSTRVGRAIAAITEWGYSL
jgi:NadR type nicotinamide-nucleotide adenylyltransferase